MDLDRLTWQLIATDPDVRTAAPELIVRRSRELARALVVAWEATTAEEAAAWRKQFDEREPARAAEELATVADVRRELAEREAAEKEQRARRAEQRAAELLKRTQPPPDAPGGAT